MQRIIAAVTITAPVVASASPIAKVISMISDLEVKVIKEGEAAQAEFAKYSEWCEDRSRNLGFEIKTGNAEVEDLKANIAKEASLQASLTTKIEELAAGVATDDADLKAATEIRAKEAADFSAEEKELSETIDMLNRAIRILSREMKGGASMMQLKNAANLQQALSVMVSASLIGTSDAGKLTAFVQASQADADDAPGAPAAAAYESQSGGIVDTMEDLLDKAQTQLDETRKKEVTAQNNFEMMKQSLTDEIKFANKDKDAAAKDMAASAEIKSTAEGDLKATSKELAADIDTKSSLHQDCMTSAQEFESTTKSRAEELKALATAKKVIKEATSAASFVQLSSSLTTGEHLANFEAVRLVRDLARKQHSTNLAQLASRMASIMRAGGRDPFGKIKSLITDMISKLEKAAGADATEKAYCDKELKETNAKKEEKTAEIEKLTTRIDQALAKSGKLKEEVSTLENELSKLAKSQAEMDKLRQEEKEAFDFDKAENDKALEGIKSALKILREYYAKDADHDTSDGASSGIIGLLEVVESDITKTLASLTSEEETSIAEYESDTQKNTIDRTSKEQSVKYKTKESKELDKTTAENTADRSGVSSELDAVLEYLARIEDRCIAKAESYEERARRREAELAGLKQALEILENETALLQRMKYSRTLRGSAVNRH